MSSNLPTEKKKDEGEKKSLSFSFSFSFAFFSFFFSFSILSMHIDSFQSVTRVSHCRRERRDDESYSSSFSCFHLFQIMRQNKSIEIFI